MYAFKRENWFWKAFQKQNGAKICFDTFMTPLIFISVDFRSSYQKLGSSSSLACFACKKPQKFGCVKHLYLCPRQAWSSGKLKSVSLQKLFTLKFLRRCTNIRLRYTRKKKSIKWKVALLGKSTVRIDIRYRNGAYDNKRWPHQAKGNFSNNSAKINWANCFPKFDRPNKLARRAFVLFKARCFRDS